MFELNETVEFVWTDNSEHKKFIGSECTIMEMTDDDVEGHRVYIVSFYDGMYASAKCLRKKKPPEEASWEEIQKSIGWNPTKQGIEV